MAESVLKLDDQVDDMNRDAFKALGNLIKEKPELSLQALNALIISRNLERVGDHATNIAEDVIFWVKAWRGCKAPCRAGRYDLMWLEIERRRADARRLCFWRVGYRSLRG